jgi:hypothetical protein
MYTYVGGSLGFISMDYIGFMSFLLLGIKARVLMKLAEKRPKTRRLNNAE